ncbi:hypothetical protein [Pedobacter xixiisoli]|nr:hypothetical protein [Pedobacter xixiisoli]
MKLKHLAWAFLALPLAYSCGQGGNKESKEETSKVVADTVKQCYTASFEGDSAILDLKVIDSVKVIGDLVIKYAEKPHNNGIVRGEFKGDTLYVDYSFKTGQNKQEFSNPLVFLKQGTNLKMGVGVIETSFGRSYFAKDKPINFERGKFDFVTTECK